MNPLTIAIVTSAVVLAIMVAEAVYAGGNDRRLRARGAFEPPGDVYKTMRWAYPGSFVAMAVEGALTGPASSPLLAVGVVVFVLAKALKVWAIRSLGERWSYRVLILPDAPLVTTGPYAFLHHPNYLAVIGELVGVALVVRAPIMGLLTVIGFGSLMWQRVQVEDRALRGPTRS